jgi:phospholipase/carboxylesterase
MALSMLLTRPELMLGCIVWHGRLLAQMQALEAKADAFHGRKLWVSHGVHDDVVPRSSAQAIAHHFDTLPVSVTFREFSSAHEIRPSELAQTLAWLEGLSTTPTAF